MEIKTELVVKASEQLKKEIEEDLKQEDVAIASILKDDTKKTCGNCKRSR